MKEALILLFVIIAFPCISAISFDCSPENPTTTTTVNLSANMTGMNDAVVMYVWDFGDGHFYTNNDKAYHRYADNGNYTVKLTAVDNKSVVHQCNKTIYIANTLPNAGFSWDIQCPNPKEIIHFTSKSNDPDGTIVSWYWNISGKIVETKDTVHAFMDAGTFNVTLTVTDDDGGNSTITKHIVIKMNKPPDAVFTVGSTTVSTGNDVLFHGNSVDSDGDVVERLWDFGDGTTSSEQNPTHTFKKSGDYMVNLTVTDDDGAKSMYSVKMHVDGGNTPAFGLFALIVAFCITKVYMRIRD